MSSLKALIFEDNYLSGGGLNNALRYYGSFLSERGHDVLNISLILNKPPSTNIFEETLRLVKSADLAIFLLTKENLLLGFFMERLLKKQKKILCFTTNRSLFDHLHSITFANFYLYFTLEQKTVINTLKLFKL